MFSGNTQRSPTSLTDYFDDLMERVELRHSVHLLASDVCGEGMKAGPPAKAADVPIVAASPPLRQKGNTWSSRTAFAKPTNINSIQHPRKHRCWRWSCIAAGGSIMWPWNSAKRGGNAGKARARHTIS